MSLRGSGVLATSYSPAANIASRIGLAGEHMGIYVAGVACICFSLGVTTPGRRFQRLGVG